jgi:hypothetical protein
MVKAFAASRIEARGKRAQQISPAYSSNVRTFLRAGAEAALNGTMKIDANHSDRETVNSSV